MFSILIKYRIQIITAICIVLLGYTTYAKIYSMGYNSAEVKYQHIILQYQEDIAIKIGALEKASVELATVSENNSHALTENLNSIVSAVKNKPLYRIENGKCTPSEDFIDSYNSVIIRGNQK